MCNLDCKFCCNYVLKQRPLPSHSSVHQCNSHHIIYLDIPEEKPLLDKHKSSYLYFYMIIRNIWSSLRHPQILAISNRKNIHIQTPKKSTQGQAFIFLWLLWKQELNCFPSTGRFYHHHSTCPRGLEIYTKVTTLRTHITTWTLNLHESYPSLDNMPQTTQRGRAEKLVLYQTIIVDIAPLQLL